MRYSEILSIRIKDLCTEHDITINRLATYAGLKQSTIDKIIHGKSQNPTIETLHKIATVFEMTMSQFLDFKEMNEYSLDEEDDDDE